MPLPLGQKELGSLPLKTTDYHIMYDLIHGANDKGGL